ncbi:MAG: Mg-chelatase subunit ChlD [Bradymonadia bacterium]|jgi:Mg-chelatase subunit ChlD
MRLLLLLAATCISGCIEETETEPKAPVRETGYIECTVSADCDGALRCTAADGASRCVENDFGRGTCLVELCECWASTICASDDICLSDLESLECVPSDEFERELTAVWSHGVCPAPDDDTQLQISLTLWSRPRLGAEGQQSLSPASLVDGLDGPLGQTLTHESFAFEALPDRDFEGAQPATATRVDQDTVGLTPSAQALRYDASAPAAERLLIFALDHSESLIGRVDGEVDIDIATDIRDARIAFFRTLAGSTRSDTYLSLISFQNEIATVDPEYATPTRNRDIIVSALTDLESGTDGATPLAAALTAIRESVVAPNSELEASVVLFTDGVERGDPTDPDRSILEAEIEAYAAAKITVYVTQLRPPVGSGNDRERDPKLIELACRTGGAYLFIEEPSEFTDPRANLANLLSARMDGVWRLTAGMPGLADLAAGWWAIATRLTLQIGALEREVDLSMSDSPERAFDDTRLWLRRD